MRVSKLSLVSVFCVSELRSSGEDEPKVKCLRHKITTSPTTKLQAVKPGPVAQVPSFPCGGDSSSRYVPGQSGIIQFVSMRLECDEDSVY